MRHSKKRKFSDFFYYSTVTFVLISEKFFHNFDITFSLPAATILNFSKSRAHFLHFCAYKSIIPIEFSPLLCFVRFLKQTPFSKDPSGTTDRGLKLFPDESKRVLPVTRTLRTARGRKLSCYFTQKRSQNKNNCNKTNFQNS